MIGLAHCPHAQQRDLRNGYEAALRYYDELKRRYGPDFTEARRIAQEELMKKPLDHNNMGDALRHAEWGRRMVEEINLITSILAGYGHELEGIRDGQPFSETMMDLHNNAVGREAGKQGLPVNPLDLRVIPPGTSYKDTIEDYQ